MKDLGRAWSAFIDGKGKFAENASFKEPDFKWIREKIAGGGMSGEISAPMMLEEQTATLTMYTYDLDAMRAFGLSVKAPQSFIFRRELFDTRLQTTSAITIRMLATMDIEFPEWDLKAQRRASRSRSSSSITAVSAGSVLFTTIRRAASSPMAPGFFPAAARSEALTMATETIAFSRKRSNTATRRSTADHAARRDGGGLASTPPTVRRTPAARSSAQVATICADVPFALIHQAPSRHRQGLLVRRAVGGQRAEGALTIDASIEDHFPTAGAAALPAVIEEIASVYLLARGAGRFPQGPFDGSWKRCLRADESLSHHRVSHEGPGQGQGERTLPS
ncbi:phage major tail tube protein [Shinella sp.]|uniref:phage major tail tube protein n=1 Tax=Shinella sp. TaxID=1870904 RepID=UPI00258A3E36|nr:phage major tail tube protein [Shinella sp.]MCW5712748.1 phage major tail tube protein [Shinella sp.]